MKDDRIRQLEKALRITGACSEPLSDFCFFFVFFVFFFRSYTK